jgi:TP901 family phage tail tape measure protein
MEEVGKLYVSLELEDEKFLQGLTAAENKFEKTKETVLKMEKTFQDIGVKMAAFGAVVVGAMGLAANSWAEAGDSIGKMSKRTGIGTTALQELSYAAKLSGTSIDEIEVAVRKMQSSVTDAETGLETAKKSFQDLGLSIKDIKSLSPEDQFNRISEAIAGIENPTKRAALAQDIFGRSGTMLLPMLAEGSAGLRKLRDDAHQYSVIMNTESVAAAEEFSDRMDNLKLSLKSVWQEIAVSIIPAVTKFVSIVQDTVTGVKKWGQAQPELTSFLATTTLAVGALSVAVGTLLIARQRWSQFLELSRRFSLLKYSLQ